MLMVKHAKNPRSDKPIISPLQHIHVPCAKQHIAKIYNRRRPIGRSLHSASPEAPSETVAKKLFSVEQKGKIKLGFSLVGLLDFESSWDFESKTRQVRMKTDVFFSKKLVKLGF